MKNYTELGAVELWSGVEIIVFAARADCAADHEGHQLLLRLCEFQLVQAQSWSGAGRHSYTNVVVGSLEAQVAEFVYGHCGYLRCEG